MNYNNYFGNNGFPPQMQYGNQFYGQQIQSQRSSQPEQYIPQPVYKQVGLQGKSVDSIEVVKATDIPLDGSVSYFPIADGSAIVTKQLQMDGTSKTIIYKPTEQEPIETPKFITEEQLENKMKQINNNEYKEDIKKINRKIEDLTDEVENISKNLKKRKDD